MSLRCKPGDLCYVVRAVNPDNLGIVLRTLRLTPWQDCVYDGFSGPVWEVEGEYSGKIAGFGFAFDCQLRPITPPKNSVTSDEVRKLFAPSELVEVVR